MKPFVSKYNINGVDFVQNYIFSDFNGDKIQAVSFSYDKNEELNKYLKINSIYRVSKANKRTNFSKDFSFTNGDIQLLFSHYTLVEELSEEETKGQIFKDKTQLTKINEIIKSEDINNKKEIQEDKNSDTNSISAPSSNDEELHNTVKSTEDELKILELSGLNTPEKTNTTSEEKNEQPNSSGATPTKNLIGNNPMLREIEDYVQKNMNEMRLKKMDLLILRMA